MGTSRAENGSQARPYKRKLTEKRRMQNRAAQRTYRERRKERLDLLEQALASSRTKDQAVQQTNTTTVAPSQLHPLTSNMPHGASTIQIALPAFEGNNREEGLLVNEAPHTLLSEPSLPPIEATLNDLTTPGKKTSDLVLNFSLHSDLTEKVVAKERNSQSRSNAAGEAPFVPHTKGTTVPFPLERSAGTSSKSDFLSSTLPRASEISINLMEKLELLNEDDGHNLANFAVTEKLDLRKVVLEGLRILKFQSSEYRAIASNPNMNPTHTPRGVPELPQSAPSTNLDQLVPILPNPYNNNIYLRHQTMQEAFCQNSRAIGLSLEQVMKPDCRSPFYSSSAACLAPTICNTIPSDLQPTPTQIQFPHHPFLDLLPFPWFRSRVIALDALAPSGYSRVELKMDILGGGLNCWKSRGSAAGQPWDRKSWEAEPWFLAKWAWLLEQDGEIERQSKWWRGLRGE
ncbi:uncharacterized protein BDR25DRAFT_342475 [Lindgomyces ingoldianus]|uniref:Uncharacterized protein n=1 Tax=Lindgomyces ingoldianus TaxID=673940 RepID=A0ACB6QXU5_9PLEO|nr:uncharacterized protein BDR25DRAFT_342475 [Lindgomyces ingoldianus]KAF2471874.1 hypothetical protein BDR25DRAFT_342475 [Lindgomyces ingoldianus]